MPDEMKRKPQSDNEQLADIVLQDDELLAGISGPDPSNEKVGKTAQLRFRTKAGRTWPLNTLKRDLDERNTETESDLFRTSPDSLLQLVAMIVHSPFVQSNPLYAARANASAFQYDDACDEFNAFAAELDEKDRDKKMMSVIVMLGGLARTNHLVSLGIGRDRITPDEAPSCLPRLMRDIGGKLMSSGCIGVETARGVINRNDLSRVFDAAEGAATAASFLAAMNIAVIAHELGHIALGHTLGGLRGKDISRNQEREADSFAASVISSTPFSDYLVPGQILLYLLFTWLEHGGTSNWESATHPMGRERLLNAINAHRRQAEELGIIGRNAGDLITEHDVQLWLPEDVAPNARGGG